MLYSNDPLTKELAPDAGALSGDPNATYTIDTTDTIRTVALVVDF